MNTVVQQKGRGWPGTVGEGREWLGMAGDDREWTGMAGDDRERTREARGWWGSAIKIDRI